MIPGAGDELQGIKRGIIEMLDGMVINKTDGDNRERAQRARAEYASTLHLFPPSPDGWTPPVLTCSALQNEGIADVWEMVIRHRAHQKETGCFEGRRRRQALDWMRDLVSQGLQGLFQKDAAVQARLPVLEDDVRRGEITPSTAARELLDLFRRGS